MKISTRILSLLLITAMLLSLLTIIPTATQRSTTAEPCVNEAIEVSFNDLEDGDVIAIVMHTSPEMTDKDYVLLNNFGTESRYTAKIYEGEPDDTMYWTVTMIDGVMKLCPNGSSDFLYSIFANAGLKIGKEDAGAIGYDEANGYLMLRDVKGVDRHLGVYDVNGEGTANFRAYKPTAEGGVDANIANETLTIYKLGFHAWNSSNYTTAPTCTENGKVVYTCTICGAIRAETIPATGHSWDMGNITLEPTCAEDGERTYTCTTCGDTKTEEIPAFGHTWNDGKITLEPTCTVDGEMTYTCVVCGEIKTDVIPALGEHNWDDGTITLEPTCTVDGEMTYTCVVCGEIKVEVIPAGHSFNPCGVCSVCGLEVGGYVAIYNPANGKAMTTEVTVYTYMNGNTKNQIVPADASLDAEGKLITEATNVALFKVETKDGITTFTTQDGKYLYMDSKNVHYVDEPGEYTNFVLEAADGGFFIRSNKAVYVNGTTGEEKAQYLEYYAGPNVFTVYNLYADMADIYTFTFPGISNFSGHTWSDGEITLEPTCAEDGERTYTCTTCGDSKTEAIPALGHTWSDGEITLEPTCTANGEAIYTCTACGESRVEVISAPGHSYRASTTAPTCTQSGFTVITCEVCSDSRITDEKAPLGHSYEAVVTEPTCTTAGFTTHTCSRCADSYVDAQTEAFGHSYKFTDNGEDHTIICKDCDMVHLVGAHTYFDGICLCGALEPKKPTHDETLKFSMDISARAEMVVNYNFMASIVSDYSDFYLEVRKDTADGEPVVTTYAIGDFDSMDHPVTGEALIYNATYSGISAKEMGDSFATTLYAVDAEGNIFYGETVTSSIKDFLIGKINDASSIPEMKTMAVDMLKYGAAAQIRFDYDSDNLVTNSLTALQLAYGTEDIPEAENKCSESGSAANVTTNITVGSKVELSLSCICNDVTDPSNVKCLIMDEKNNVLARLDTTNKAGVMFSAKYDNVGAKEMRKVITATFYDGRNVISKTLKWSVESYVAQIRQTPGATAEEIALVNAMLTYGDSVAAYMTANGL